VVPVRKSEPQEQAARRSGAERIDQLFPEQAHRRGAQDHDTLIVEADDALIWAEIEQLREVQLFRISHPAIL
jgi:hypothetical protein